MAIPHPSPLRRRGSVIRTKKKLVEIKNSCLQKSNSCNSCLNARLDDQSDRASAGQACPKFVLLNPISSS